MNRASEKKIATTFAILMALLALLGLISFWTAATGDTRVALPVIATASILALLMVGISGWIIYRDIAALNSVEDERERFFTISLDMLCIASSDGHFKRVSPAFTHTLGWSEKEMLTRPFIDFVHPDDRAATLNEVQRQVAAGEKVMHFENRYQHKDGSWRILAWRSIPQPGGRMYATARDVTESREQERRIREAKAAADEANLAKSHFLANMSHEIRTPLAAIIGYADLLFDPGQSAVERFHHINTIRRNGEHLLTLINDILDFSKIEAGKLVAEPIPCSPGRILADVESVMRIRASEKSIQFDIKNDGPIPERIVTDPTRLRQVLINIIGNAIKFTDHGAVTVLVSLDEPANLPPKLRFDIADTGIGMNPLQISQLFQPFVQADVSTTRRFGGTGLGLTISKRLAELLGGTITVLSSPGQGSTFSFTVDPGSLKDVSRLHSWRDVSPDSRNQTFKAATDLLNANILLVDDGEDNCNLLAAYLRIAGATVQIAENGRIGSDLALASLDAGSPFDVILMDMQMPVLDGYSATQLLRSQGYSAPIVALTANAMTGDREKCVAAGCTDYLSKPVQRAELIQMVVRHAGRPDSHHPFSN